MIYEIKVTTHYLNGHRVPQQRYLWCNKIGDGFVFGFFLKTFHRYMVRINYKGFIHVSWVISAVVGSEHVTSTDQGSSTQS